MRTVQQSALGPNALHIIQQNILRQLPHTKIGISQSLRTYKINIIPCLTFPLPFTHTHHQLDSPVVDTPPWHLVCPRDHHKLWPKSRLLTLSPHAPPVCCSHSQAWWLLHYWLHLVVEEIVTFINTMWLYTWSLCGEAGDTSIFKMATVMLSQRSGRTVNESALSSITIDIVQPEPTSTNSKARGNSSSTCKMIIILWQMMRDNSYWLQKIPAVYTLLEHHYCPTSHHTLCPRHGCCRSPHVH